MHIELLDNLNETKFNTWKAFLDKFDLIPDRLIDRTVLIWDNDSLIAAGSRYGNVLKCIAVDESRQGEGLTATLITALEKDAFSEGIRHLFLYTKPQNKPMFRDLFFYPVAQTETVLLMENKKDGINEFLSSFDAHICGKSGCVVANCNPFTSGHRYLIEKASKECDILYVFVVSEDKSRFSACDRMEMVKRGTADILNVRVLPTGPYLISSATFPTYFLKDRGNAEQVKCLLDIEIFIKYYAPKFNITTRYVGTEPLSTTTKQYNKELKKLLPAHGIEIKELERFEISNVPVSASQVRALIDAGNKERVKSLVPHTTYDFLLNKNLI